MIVYLDKYLNTILNCQIYFNRKTSLESITFRDAEEYKVIM